MKAKKPKEVQPIFLDRGVVESVRNLAAQEQRSMKVVAETLLREALEARVAKTVPAP